MNPSITFEVHLPINIKKSDNIYISSCDILDVISQGESEKKAKENLKEAIELFLITCHEMGTLDRVLNDCGFTLSKPKNQPNYPKKNEMAIKVPFYLNDSDKTLCRA